MEICLQCDSDVEKFLDLPIDIFYFGERSCHNLLLKKFTPKKVKEICGHIHERGKKAYLCIPLLINQKDLSYILSYLKNILGFVDGILTADMGVVVNFKGKTNFVYFGALTNTNLAKTLFRAGFSRARLSLPHHNIIKNTSGSLKKEIVVYGSMPLSFSPFCLHKQFNDPCSLQCEKEISLKQGNEKLILVSKLLRTDKKANILEFLPLLENHIDSYVIETYGLEKKKILKIINAIKNGKSITEKERSFSGFLLCDNREILRSGPWRKKIRAGGE